MKERPQPRDLLVYSGAFVVAFAWDLIGYDRGPLLAALAGIVPVLGGLATQKVTARADVGWAAAAGLALWSVPHGSSETVLIGSVVPGLLLAYGPLPRWTATMATGGSTAALLFVLGAPVAGTLVWGLAAAALSLARPEAPTEGTVRALRASALLLPGVGLAGALALNAATGRAEHLSIPEAIEFGIGLAALLALASTAGLGLSTLLESDTPYATRAWSSLSASLGIVAGAAQGVSPLFGFRSLAVSALPLAALSLILAARLASGRARRARWWFAMPVGLFALQFGLI